MTTPTPSNSEKGGLSPDSPTSPVIITASTDQTENPKPAKISPNPVATTADARLSPQREFRPLPFLYRTLIGIFIVEAVFLGLSFTACRDLALKNPPKTIQEHCPRIGERAENLFGISIATVLSLMTGQAVEEFKKNKDS